MNLTPNKDTFLKLAHEGNLIPVSLQILAGWDTPLSAYQKLRGDAESFLFESVEGGERLSRYSFVGMNPRGVIRQTEDTVEWIDNGVTKVSRPVTPENDALRLVEEAMGQYQPVAPAVDAPFTGGAVGFIGYEFVHQIEPSIPKPEKNELNTPVIYFLIADEILIFDHVTQRITIVVNVFVDSPNVAETAYERAEKRVNEIQQSLASPLTAGPDAVPIESPELPFESNTTHDDFIAKVEKAKSYIHEGDIIQVVGSQRFSGPVSASPVDIYRAARSTNPSPYMFLLELEGFTLVGASPETHVRLENRRVQIRPIAGTRPRGATEKEDLALEKELLADPKERAEHVMLVDLARNDIGRVCEYGSVEVKDLMIIERYSHVMHIVSQVEGQLTADKTPYDLMRATFPAGTLSGAPKVRAMQIISELEQTQRGPYGGCVGYFSFNGNLDCCITIRTALLKDGHAYIQAGGGWVADSDPEAEFQETVNKSASMRRSIALAEAMSAEAKKS